MNSNQSYLADEVKRLHKLQPWNHNYVLSGGIQTNPGMQTLSHGKNETKYKRLRHIFDEIDFNGKKVLDLGCNEGFFSFELAKRGAIVHGIDIDANRLQKANFIKKTLYPQMDVDFTELDIYTANLEYYDYVICLGFLHRIPDPFSALKILTRNSDCIIFEWKVLKHGHHSRSIAYFSEKPFNERDPFGTEYWLLSFSCLKLMLTRLGHERFVDIDDPSQKRGILISHRNTINLNIKDSRIITPFLQRMAKAGKETVRLFGDAIRGTLN